MTVVLSEVPPRVGSGVMPSRVESNLAVYPLTCLLNTGQAAHVITI